LLSTSGSFSDIYVDKNRSYIIKATDECDILSAENELHMGLTYTNILPNFARTYGHVKTGPYYSFDKPQLVSWILPSSTKAVYPIIEYILVLQ
jgi:hypothetical protein